MNLETQVFALICYLFPLYKHHIKLGKNILQESGVSGMDVLVTRLQIS